ncbi:MAG: M28 family peptidase, partial [Ginsengibacter sp.]
MKKIKQFTIFLFLYFPVIGFCQNKITGFTDESSVNQLQLESKFDQSLSSKEIGEFIKELSSKPHHLGSARGKEIAEYILSKFKDWGWDAKIETYMVLFPVPKTRILEATIPSGYHALLSEPALKEDATSGQQGQLPTYNAWSADGDVNGELVFVNYGLPGDYEKLSTMGIDVKGKIVIAKYGHSWRGIKPKLAQEHGAIGCIIYSDPLDDGYSRGDVYPKGAFKSEFGVQRGSVMDMVIYPGDPLTPNVGATKNAKRLDRKDAANLLKIPVLPISYHDAQPLLEALTGPIVPPEWRGGLPFTYHVGPGKATVHLKLDFDWKLVPAYNVIAMIKGAENPDQWVIRGNHHDAWVNGANDPVSGLASLMGEARSIGNLAKTGWRPKRTLVYCAWDGEEPGLIGSTEWTEDHTAELQNKGVVYINTDDNGRGFLDAAGSHTLETIVEEVTKNIMDPQTKISVYNRARSYKIINALNSKTKKEALDKNGLTLEALGSGSDYSSFLQHVGVPSLNFGFAGENDGGEYHSIYDSYDNYVRFKDPGFEYGVALAKTAGHTALRMANADLLPFDFKTLYKTVNGYIVELVKLLDDMRESTDIENKLINDSLYMFAADPQKVYKVPPVKTMV